MTRALIIEVPDDKFDKDPRAVGEIIGIATFHEFPVRVEDI